MSGDKDKELARTRAAVIFAVQGGHLTAEEGARRLGVSRKTYYEWERRALAAMTVALENRAPGRPDTPKDEEKERMQEDIAKLQNKLFIAQKTVEVRDMLHAYELHNARATKRADASQGKKRKQRKK